jgi:uncharacterized protein involved in exopolysaccharide biosynthesis
MNFLFILRQRLRALTTAFIAGVLIYGLCVIFRPKEYSAMATVQGYAPVHQAQTAAPAVLPYGDSDFSSRVLLMKSPTIIEKVVARMKDAEHQEFLAPVKSLLPWAHEKTVGEVLAQNRVVTSDPASEIIEVSFVHPVPVIAANVANLFADEFVKESLDASTARLNKTLGDLQAQADEQHKKMTGDQDQMNLLVDKFGLANLDPTGPAAYQADIEQLTQIMNENKAVADVSSSSAQLVKSQIDTGKPLWDLSFIASQPRVIELNKVYSQQLGLLAEARNEQYAEDSSEITVIKGRVTGAELELSAAAQSAASMIVSDAEAAQNNYDQSLKRLQEKQGEAEELSKGRTVYESLRNDRDMAENLYKTQIMSINQQQTALQLSTPTYSLVQPAGIPTQPIWPTLGHMTVMALCSGFAASLFVAFAFVILEPPPPGQREEYERRRRRHRHFHSSHRK